MTAAPTTTAVPTRAAQVISSEAELRALLGEPSERALTKERTRLHPRDREWLAASPLCIIATAGADGTCDASPKGDPPGFVRVLDDRTIAIPERPGNRRADGYRNVLANPQVGIISILPGRDLTLRLNGRATLVRDAPWFDDMTVRGHRPVLALVVELEQVFLHCGKAFMRAQAWDPATWTPDAVPSTAQLTKEVQDRPEPLEQLEAHYGPAYAQGLYADVAGQIVCTDPASTR